MKTFAHQTHDKFWDKNGHQYNNGPHLKTKQPCYFHISEPEYRLHVVVHLGIH